MCARLPFTALFVVVVSSVVPPSVGAQCVIQSDQLLKADVPTSQALLGGAIVVRGDTAIFGAGGFSNALGAVGTAYVFRFDGLAWSQSAQLLANEGQAGDEFGLKLDFDGDSVIVGVANDSANGDMSGAAYIFQQVGGAWQQVARLTASDAAADQRFGASVAISGETAFVGAPYDNGFSVEGFPHTVIHAGSVYVFQNIDGIWTQVTKLTLPDADNNDFFGDPVALDGNSAAIRSFGRLNISFFQRVDGAWQYVTSLTAADGAPTGYFGRSLAIAGGIVVSGDNHDSDMGVEHGSAHVFRAVDGTWVEVAELYASDGSDNDRFGQSVSVSGDSILVGEQGNIYSNGSAYLFREVDGRWREITILHSPPTNDRIAFSVGIAGNTALVSSHLNDQVADNSGAVYVFDVSATHIPGDIDDNGTVDLADASTFVAVLLGYDTNPEYIDRADLDCSGSTDGLDVQPMIGLLTD